MPRFFGFTAKCTKASSCIILFKSSRSTIVETFTDSFNCSSLMGGRFIFLVTGWISKYLASSFFIFSCMPVCS